MDIDLPQPEPRGHDILVAVRAVSVNPVDTKVRMRAQPEAGQWKVLGWDAAGEVTAVGPERHAVPAGRCRILCRCAGTAGHERRVPSGG